MAELVSIKKAVRRFLVEEDWDEEKIDAFLRKVNVTPEQLKDLRLPTKGEEALHALSKSIPAIRDDMERQAGKMGKVLLAVADRLAALSEAVAALSKTQAKKPEVRKPKRWKLHIEKSGSGYDVTALEE